MLPCLEEILLVVLKKLSVTNLKLILRRVWLDIMTTKHFQYFFHYDCEGTHKSLCELSWRFCLISPTCVAVNGYSATNLVAPTMQNFFSTSVTRLSQFCSSALKWALELVYSVGLSRGRFVLWLSPTHFYKIVFIHDLTKFLNKMSFFCMFGILSFRENLVIYHSDILMTILLQGI